MEKEGDKMKILVTGAHGFIGKNLVSTLETIRDGKNRTRPNLYIEEIIPVGRETSEEELCAGVNRADFVVHLAGVNRPQQEIEFTTGNVEYSRKLRDMLQKTEKKPAVWVSSSTQATLKGRYVGSIYGQSKRDAETIWEAYEGQTYLYRLPNVFGKWCKPHYNSAIATFCYQLSRNLPLQVNDPSVTLELVYIDDVVSEMLDAMEKKAHRAAVTPFYEVPVTHTATLGEIVTLLDNFNAQPTTLMMPEIPVNSFEKKLWSTFLSYLPKERVKQSLVMHEDARGSFTEILKTKANGQVSINISKPGITKGEHWHHSKWEIFLVVSGEGIIQQRRIGRDENGQLYPIVESHVSGEKLEAVYILPGYTHNIINKSETENLVTVMWVNEPFDVTHPETYAELVVDKED